MFERRSAAHSVGVAPIDEEWLMSDGLRGHPKRFYEWVEAAEVDGGFSLRLDGRAARSPGGRRLVLPTRALAELIVSEWSAQGDEIAFVNMPATRLAQTALDAVGPNRAEAVAGLTSYAATDLLCYWAENPASLVERQQAVWEPLLTWARVDLGLVFRWTQGITHRPQPQTTLSGVSRLAEQTGDFALTGLAFGAALFGSTILSLALRAGRVDAERAMNASRLDELFQEERWGRDAEASARVARSAAEALTLEHWFRALA